MRDHLSDHHGHGTKLFLLFKQFLFSGLLSWYSMKLLNVDPNQGLQTGNYILCVVRTSPDLNIPTTMSHHLSSVHFLTSVFPNQGLKSLVWLTTHRFMARHRQTYRLPKTVPNWVVCTRVSSIRLQYKSANCNVLVLYFFKFKEVFPLSTGHGPQMYQDLESFSIFLMYLFL